MWAEKLDLPLNFTLLTSKHKIKNSCTPFRLFPGLALFPSFPTPVILADALPAPHPLKQEKVRMLKTSPSAEEVKQEMIETRSPLPL